MERRLRRRVHVLEAIVVALPVHQAAVAPDVGLAQGRRAQPGDEGRGETRPRPLGRRPAVEVEAEVVELRARLPRELHRTVRRGRLERHQLHRGGGARRAAATSRGRTARRSGWRRCSRRWSRAAVRRGDRSRRRPSRFQARRSFAWSLHRQVDDVARVPLELDPVGLERTVTVCLRGSRWLLRRPRCGTGSRVVSRVDEERRCSGRWPKSHDDVERPVLVGVAVGESSCGGRKRRRTRACSRRSVWVRIRSLMSSIARTMSSPFEAAFCRIQRTVLPAPRSATMRSRPSPLPGSSWRRTPAAPVAPDRHRLAGVRAAEDEVDVDRRR